MCYLSNQATAEQIRLAQMIDDTNDADFENKIKQVMTFLTPLFLRPDYWLRYVHSPQYISLCTLELQELE